MVVFHLPTQQPNTMTKLKPNTIDVLRNVSSSVFKEGSKTQLLIQELAAAAQIPEKK